MADNGTRRKLAWLILIRAAISTILLGSATFAQITAPGSFPGNPFFFLIGLTFGLTIAYALTLRFAERNRWLIDLQLAGDALVVSAFIYFTGGIASYFSSLYVLPIVAASTVQFRRGGMLVATFSAVLYSGLVLWQYFAASGLLHDSWLAAASIALPPRTTAQYIVALNVFGFFAVALLSGSLAEGMRSAGVQLQEASSTIADLQALNQHVIDSLPSGLATTDPAHRILTFNHAAATITGFTFPSVVGRPIAEVLQLPPRFLDELERTPRGAAPKRVDLRFKTGDARTEIEIGLGATHLQIP